MFRRKRAEPIPAVQFRRYDASARSAIVYANHYSIDDEQIAISPEHLACALATTGVRDRFARFVPEVADVRRLLFERGYRTGQLTERVQRPFDETMRQIIRATFGSANAEDREMIGAEHLLFALLDRPETVGAQILLELGVDRSRDAEGWRLPPDPNEGPTSRLPPDLRGVDGTDPGA